MSSVLWRGVFLVLAVFAGGVLVGALGLRAWAQHGHMGRVFIEGREGRDRGVGRTGDARAVISRWQREAHDLPEAREALVPLRQDDLDTNTGRGQAAGRHLDVLGKRGDA